MAIKSEFRKNADNKNESKAKNGMQKIADWLQNLSNHLKAGSPVNIPDMPLQMIVLTNMTPIELINSSSYKTLQEICSDPSNYCELSLIENGGALYVSVNSTKDFDAHKAVSVTKATKKFKKLFKVA